MRTHVVVFVVCMKKLVRRELHSLLDLRMQGHVQIPLGGKKSPALAGRRTADNGKWNKTTSGQHPADKSLNSNLSLCSLRRARGIIIFLSVCAIAANPSHKSVPFKANSSIQRRHDVELISAPDSWPLSISTVIKSPTLIKRRVVFAFGGDERAGASIAATPLL